jgi:hypothetical protein
MGGVEEGAISCNIAIVNTFFDTLSVQFVIFSVVPGVIFLLHSGKAGGGTESYRDFLLSNIF